MIDIQEKLLPVINNHDKILNNAIKLLSAANVLKVPSIVSEQYPKGIGKTVKELKNLLPADLETLEKI